ncbi:SH3 domain-containing protein [Pseudopedobacter beijingensis]|uniref:SH3 domain-containing protein n=1 Tax=Pseudopedobacter beijingensis TaxID=1207056 RepID=A0ABW4I8M8_9SPHI
MKLSLFFHFSIFLFLFSCNNNQTKSIVSDNTFAEDSVKKLRDSLQMSEFTDKALLEKSERYTFSDSCYIYSQPDTNSLAIAKLPVLTRLTIFGNRPNLSKGIEWYKVETKDKRIGFIDVQDLVFGEFENKQKGYKLVAGVREKIQLGSGIVAINRINLKDNKVIETLRLPLISMPSVTEISSTTLISASKVLRYTTNSEECPGLTENYFIIDTGTRLILLAKGSSSGESSWYESSTVFIPKKLGNGKVMLVVDGSFENIFNLETGRLNVFPYPKDIGVPIENLIVIENKDIQYELDKNDDPIENEDGTYKIASKNYSTEYYSWDGEVIKKINKKY